MAYFFDQVYEKRKDLINKIFGVSVDNKSAEELWKEINDNYKDCFFSVNINGKEVKFDNLVDLSALIGAIAFDIGYSKAESMVKVEGTFAAFDLNKDEVKKRVNYILEGKTFNISDSRLEYGIEKLKNNKDCAEKILYGVMKLSKLYVDYYSDMFGIEEVKKDIAEYKLRPESEYVVKITKEKEYVKRDTDFTYKNNNQNILKWIAVAVAGFIAIMLLIKLIKK